MMSPFVLLDQVRVDDPCPKRWEEMHGDDRARFCTHCSKHVHNLSAMPAAEAEALLRDCGELCVRYLQRADGRVITTASRARHWRVLLHAGALATLVLAPGARAEAPKKPAKTAVQQSQAKPKRTVGAIKRATHTGGKLAVKKPPRKTMGAPAAKMGEPAVGPPKSAAAITGFAAVVPAPPAQRPEILGKRIAPAQLRDLTKVEPRKP